MSRPFQVRALLALMVLVAGCQDYNFNPVGHCLISPGRERVTLSNVSTADVLFVVDDSGSMAGEQQEVAKGFASFIANLDQTNVARRQAALEPIDFHLAVTTTSIFISNPTTASCRNDCPGGSGQVCCETSGSTPLRPMKEAKRCTSSTECGGAPLACRTDCQGLLGESYCCDSGTLVAPLTQPVACSTLGDACGRIQTHYRVDSSCVAGNAVNGALYPHGSFVGFGDNPRVLHFDKELYPALDGTGAPIRDAALPPCSDGSKVCNRQGFTSTQLRGFFANQNTGTWQGNVIAGTCGSGEEQSIHAGKLAVEKAVAKQQLDTRDARGLLQTGPASWLHDNSKLVVVFLGDEDDCSSPEDATKGIILTGGPGADSCVADAQKAPGDQKELAVSSMVDYFAGLGRPLGAAFIVSTQGVCQDDACVPGLCCGVGCTDTAGAPVCRNSVCGGQGAGVRQLEAAREFKAKGADVVVGSICDPDFDTILSRIAEIVKPPSGLQLPTQPASGDITVLRIATASGATRKTCNGPAPSTLTADEARAQKYDWWFTATREQVTSDQQKPTVASRFIYINHLTTNCEANAGETYSADYLGLVPAGGCLTRADCQRALGGQATDFTCYAGGDETTGFVQPTASAPGSCVCRPMQTKPDGSPDGSF